MIFANSPNNDFSVTDAKASLTVEKKGNLSISPLEQLQEVAVEIGCDCCEHCRVVMKLV